MNLPAHTEHGPPEALLVGPRVFGRPHYSPAKATAGPWPHTTTASASLGMSIARLGHRVALINADIGLQNSDLLLGLTNCVLYTAMDVFKGECRLDQALSEIIMLIRD